MKIKQFKCGLCKEEDRKWMTRLGLRKHLSEEHRIMTQKFNKKLDKKIVGKQRWIIGEEH